MGKKHVVTALARILPGTMRSAAAQAAFVSKLEAPHVPSAVHKNIILNKDSSASFTHIEFTEDSVRLEFKTSKDDKYRKLAEAKTSFEVGFPTFCVSPVP